MSDSEQYPQSLVNLSHDLKSERQEAARERLRQEFAGAYDHKPWATSLAYDDLDKVMLDLRKGRVTQAELWNAADAGRNSGTLDPRIAMRLYERLANE